jgi:hypothetical protein
MIEVSPTREPTPNLKKLENKMFSTDRILIQREWHDGTYALQSWKMVSREN